MSLTHWASVACVCSDDSYPLFVIPPLISQKPNFVLRHVSRRLGMTQIRPIISALQTRIRPFTTSTNSAATKLAVFTMHLENDPIL